MTGFVLVETVDYEGSQLIGMFSTLTDIIEFLRKDKNHKRHIAAFNENREIELHVDEHMANSRNAPIGATQCWRIDGIADLTYYIYSFAL